MVQSSLLLRRLVLRRWLSLQIAKPGHLRPCGLRPIHITHRVLLLLSHDFVMPSASISSGVRPHQRRFGSKLILRDGLILR